MRIVYLIAEPNDSSQYIDASSMSRAFDCIEVLTGHKSKTVFYECLYYYEDHNDYKTDSIEWVKWYDLNKDKITMEKAEVIFKSHRDPFPDYQNPEVLKMVKELFTDKMKDSAAYYDSISIIDFWTDWPRIKLKAPANIENVKKPKIININRNSMEFRASFCDPFKKDIIELGAIDKDKIMEKFESINWSDYLKRLETAGENEVYYSPSLEIENSTNKNGLSVSAIDDTEWYIFFKRPKMVKKFFGLSEKLDENYLTDVTGQTEQDVRDCLKALINNDLEFLEDKIK